MKKTLLFSAVIATIGFIISIAFWDKVPNSMPVHWNFSGQPDGFMPKEWGLLLFPGLVFFISLLTVGLIKLDPRKENLEGKGSQRAMRWIFSSLSVFFLVLHSLVIYASMTSKMNLSGELVLIMVGGLLVVMGWVLPKMESNWFIGIRTPWTLSSEVVWKKTHKVASFWMIGSGLLVIPLVLLLPQKIGFLSSVIVMSLSGIVPVVLSYVYYTEEKNAGQGGKNHKIEG